MAVRSLRRAVRLYLPCAVFLATGLALAQEGANDKQALKLAHEAITMDYLATNFAEAEKKLRQALTLCGGNTCSKRVQARLHRDLGLVYIAGLNKMDQGKAEFTEALKADPTIPLDVDLITPDVQKAFNESAAALGIQPAAPTRDVAPAPEAAPTAPAPPAAAPAATSDGLIHTPPAEQIVNTPVPIFVQPGAAGTSYRMVKIHYRPFGSKQWKSLEMGKVKDGWGIEIPCLDIGDATGNLEYFIQAFGAGGAPDATSGSHESPHKVAIVRELQGPPPYLPGRAPSAQCRGTSDCPPDFPGCASTDAGVSGAPGAEEELAEPRRNWLSLAFQQDLLLLSGADRVCDEGTDYACFWADDEFYTELPYRGPNGEGGGTVAGGFNLATSRFLAGYDRLFGRNFMLGARAGYAIRGGPQAPGGNAFFPLHAEGRFAYWFGAAPFSRRGFRPFVQVSGGVAQVDTSVTVLIYRDQNDYNNFRNFPLTAWRKTGTGFVSAGGGLAFALQPEHEIVAELRVMQMLGQSGTAFGLTLGYALGL